MNGEEPLRAPSFSRKTPDGDDRERDVCNACGYVAYQNPKIVVGSVASYGAKILLCRRAIEPRRGYWTLPAGYLELGESVEDGARREAWEEARVRLDIDRVLAIYSVPRISQVQIMFRARLSADEASPGPESLETALFDWDGLPWADLAFPTVGWALRHWREARGRADFAPFANPVDGV
ncbi:MAG: NUDIX domain-containing protein [Parvularculaceae bacterium]